MLEKILESCNYVLENSKHVTINYEKVKELIKELVTYNNTHYLLKVPYNVYSMSTEDIVNFLLIYDSIDFSFWGDPKWTINADDKKLDGGIALLHCIFKLFERRSSIDVYRELESMSLEDFKLILKGNIEIPLLEERYNIIKNIVTIVNKNMNGNFYHTVKDLTIDKDVFNIILENFDNFKDIREYKGKTIYFYKLAQLLTSDILHVLKIKENKIVDYSNLVGCADYKIPQVMQAYGILNYDEKLTNIIKTKIEINENSEYEVEIRANMLMVINYIWKKINKSIDRIHINDFIWSKGQNKLKSFKPYHLTRTKSY